MTLLAQLNYRYPRRNAMQRAAVRIASSRPGAWWLARLLPDVDGWVLALTRGRTSLVELVAGTPVISLTVRGSRTGIPRTRQLLGIPVNDTIAVIGTNFAQGGNPDWVHNLLAEPRAVVSYRDSRLEVIAREAAGSEYEQIFAAANLVFPGYGVYRSRLPHPPKVFVLEPHPATGS